LDANAFRIQRRFGQCIDDAEVDAAAGEFDGSGQRDGPGADDQDLGAHCVFSLKSA
jgi:hypothetical protein